MNTQKVLVPKREQVINTRTSSDKNKKKDEVKENDKSKFNNRLEEELNSMVLLSVKGESLPEDAKMNPEIPNEEDSKTAGLINSTLEEIKSKFGFKSVKNEKNVEVDINQMVNSETDSSKQFVLNVKGEDVFINAEQKENIKKQINLLEEFDNSDIMIKVKDNAKSKLLKKSTNDLIDKHNEFLSHFKDIVKSSKEDNDMLKVLEDTNLQVDKSMDKISKSNRTFFDGLISGIHKNKIVNNSAKDNPANEASLINILSSEIENIENVDGKSFNSDGGDNQTFGSKESTLDKNIEILKSIKMDDFKGELKSKQVENRTVNESRNYQFFNNVKIKEVITNTVKAVKNVPSNGSSIARMTLNPKALGKVFVEIRVIENVAKINFKTEAKEVMKALETQIDVLSTKLNEIGVSTESVELSLNDKDNSSDERNQLMKRFTHHEDAETKKEFIDSFKKLNESE